MPNPTTKHKPLVNPPRKNHYVYYITSSSVSQNIKTLLSVFSLCSTSSFQKTSSHLPLGRNIIRHQHKWTKKLDRSFAKKDVGVPLDTKLTMHQHCAPVKKASGILGCIGKSIARRPKELVLHLTFAKTCLEY
ncbi:hypothetical protein BTVI_14083 [Pitangus sulphuratus]|nr:hypothetical protein BTVI_14083 [Pitangus sulphuratus]